MCVNRIVLKKREREIGVLECFFQRSFDIVMHVPQMYKLSLGGQIL